MRGRADKPLIIVVVFILAFPVQPANAQDYTWDGAITAGVSETFYRFGPQYDMIMEPEDDDSTAKMQLPTVFPFFGTDQTMVSVETDGAIVFGEEIIESTGLFASELAYPIIAPYWDDIDLEDHGHIYYRISHSPVDLERITATVRRSTTINKDFSASWCMIVTWYKVAERGEDVTILNSFQAVLATDGESSFVIFNYGPIVWSDGAEAQAGFSPGKDGIFYGLPMSETEEIRFIDEQCQPFGVGTYLFQVDAGFNTLSCDNKDCTRGECQICCVCTEGFSGNGNTCFDKAECISNDHDCHPNATCHNTEGSFTCQCKPGHTGDGKTCSDLNECDFRSLCDENANCYNTEGSFLCECKPGYTGNGQFCTEANPCAQQPCGVSGLCRADKDKFLCFCRNGYEGINCEAPPLSLLDNTFTGFCIRIRLTRPSYEELDDLEGRRELSSDLEKVKTLVAARFGSPTFTSMTVLNQWEDADGSTIVDLQVVFSDVNGIDEEDIKAALISGFLQTGETSINPKWIQVKLNGDASDLNILPFVGLAVGTSVLILILIIIIGILSCLICRRPAPPLRAPSVYPQTRPFPPMVARGRLGNFPKVLRMRNAF